MNPQPGISIVVPSFNQARYLGETLQCLVDQDYPALDVIIQEGGSTDGSIDIARDFVERHPSLFRLFVEKDSGQADALNRGFARATGEILGFLNSDDTLYPGVLRRVAREIDPSAGRFVVMGRCLFVGEGPRYVGVEHPAEFTSHFEQLAIWKRGFNTIPQPSVFWHRSVWERCGGFDVREHHVLDYDLFCRMSKHYRFHRVDELWSTYRMHDSSKSAQRSEAEVLELSIRVSRKYWGSWFNPLRWRCEASYWLHNRHLHERATHHARRAEEAIKARNIARASIEFIKTLACSPSMARDRLLLDWLRTRRLTFLLRLLVKPEVFTGVYADGWIGPRYGQALDVPASATDLVVTLAFHPQPQHKRVRVELLIDGRRADIKSVESESIVELKADMSTRRNSRVNMELRADSYFVPREARGGEDDRHLSLMLGSVRMDTAEGGVSAAQ